MRTTQTCSSRSAFINYITRKTRYMINLFCAKRILRYILHYSSHTAKFCWCIFSPWTVRRWNKILPFYFTKLVTTVWLTPAQRTPIHRNEKDGDWNIYLWSFAHENSKGAYKNTKKNCESFKLDKSNAVGIGRLPLNHIFLYAQWA